MYPNRVVAIDFETLGLNYMYDVPTSLACVVFDDGEPTGEVFQSAIRPNPAKLKLSMEALNVQGSFIGADGKLNKTELFNAIEKIFPDDADDTKNTMIRIAEWAKDVDAFNAPCVAHRASFDLGFYDQHLASFTSVYVSALSPVWICTKTMSRAARLKGSSKFGLQETATLLGIQFDSQQGHDALYDATLCGKVYFGLIDAMRGAE